MTHASAGQPILVKRYANARLYDTTGLRYVTVEMLHAWSIAGIAFSVIDAQTGEDIRRVVLA